MGGGVHFFSCVFPTSYEADNGTISVKPFLAVGVGVLEAGGVGGGFSLLYPPLSSHLGPVPVQRVLIVLIDVCITTELRS